MNSTTRHGNFLQINNIGVWLTGEPRIGKSTLSLALIDRGHRLISDDAVVLYDRHDTVIGQAPKSIQGFLWIAGMDVIDVSKLCGNNALLDQCELHVIIHLIKSAPHNTTKNLFNPTIQTVTLFNQSFPQVIFPMRESHMPLLIETWVRNYHLKQQGNDARSALQKQHQHAIAQGIPCNKSD